MSDTHEKKDNIVRVNYAEIIASVISSSVFTPTAMATPLLSAIVESLSTLYKSKELKESKPTEDEKLRELIETGKKEGVSKMRIELDKSIAAGINLGGALGDLDADITIGVKTENHMVLEVEYK